VDVDGAQALLHTVTVRSNNMHTGANIFVNTVYSAVNKYSWRTRRMSVALVALDKTRTLWSTGRWFAVENSKKPTESWRADVGGEVTG